MAEIIVATIVIGYTGFIVYKKIKDLKAGKTCCGGCNSCGSKEKCSKEQV